MASVTWTCPNCNRRVPNRAPTCHCGTTRVQAEQLEIALAQGGGAPSVRRGAPGKLGWDIKGLAIGLALVVVLGLTWLLVPHRFDPIAPVLGFADHAPSPPPPSPPSAPRRPIPSPPFKLPWWK